MTAPLASIMNAISNDVVASLAAAGYPALTAGKVLFGPASLYEQTAPPRILFVPLGSKFSSKDVSSRSNSASFEERKRENAMRSIGTESIEFAVHCWGAAPSTNLVDDYDITRALYQAVRGSVHRLCVGSYLIDDSGKYTVSSEIVRSGREFVFGLALFTPILDSLLPYDRVRQYAPTGTKAVITDGLTDIHGNTEAGCEVAP